MRYPFYGLYDAKRDLYLKYFADPSDAHAKEEFSGVYHQIIRPGRWSTRKFGRYYLFQVGEYENGLRVSTLNRPRMVMADYDLELSHACVFFGDPPADDKELADLERAYDELVALDKKRKEEFWLKMREKHLRSA